MNYAIRVSNSYADSSGVFLLWAERAGSAFIFEHPADDKVKRTHCHLVLYDVDVKAEALKRMWKGPHDSGNSFWSFKTAKTTQEDKDNYLKYCTKGKYSAKLLKNISEQEVERAKERWVNNSPDPKPANATDKEKQITNWKIIEDVLEESRNTYGIYENKLVKADWGCDQMTVKLVIVNPEAVYGILLKHLKKHRIATEVNQLTRFMTTILRDDPNYGEELRNTVFQRLFFKPRV